LWLGKIENVGSYFSVLSSAVSIALAFVAIYIAIKQEGDSNRINNETRGILARMDEKLNNVSEKVSSLDLNQVYGLMMEIPKNIEKELSKKQGNFNIEEVKEVIESEIEKKVASIEDYASISNLHKNSASVRYHIAKFVIPHDNYSIKMDIVTAAFTEAFGEYSVGIDDIFLMGERLQIKLYIPLEKRPNFPIRQLLRKFADKLNINFVDLR
jgi:hypothetical protein